MGIILDTGFFMGICHPKDPFYENKMKKRLIVMISILITTIIIAEDY